MEHKVTFEDCTAKISYFESNFIEHAGIDHVRGEAGALSHDKPEVNQRLYGGLSDLSEVNIQYSRLY